jgi:hypothetical protein
VSPAGDVNADGIADFLVSAKDAWPVERRPEAGQVYLIFGRQTVGGNAAFPANLNVTDLNAGEGLLINGIDSYGNLGHDMAAAGDVNGDGVDDMVFGTHDAFPVELNDRGRPERSRGETYVVYGDRDGWRLLTEPKTGSLPVLEISDLDGSNDYGYVARGQVDGASVGESVAAAGDVNGDGINDVLIGAPFDGVQNSAGRAYVLFGRKPPRFCEPLPAASKHALTGRLYLYSVNLSCNGNLAGLKLQFESKPGWLKRMKNRARLRRQG